MTLSATELEQRLEEWADWLIRYSHYHLGFCNKTIEGRLIEEGGVLISGTGQYVPPAHVRPEEIEDLVKELHQHDPRLARALRVYYLEPGKLTHKARKLGVSYSQFKRYLDMAKSWLAGRLSTVK